MAGEGGEWRSVPSGSRMGEKYMEEHDNWLKDEWDSDDVDDDWRRGREEGGEEQGVLSVLLGCAWVVMAMGWVLSKVAK